MLACLNRMQQTQSGSVYHSWIESVQQQCCNLPLISFPGPAFVIIMDSTILLAVLVCVHTMQQTASFSADKNGDKTGVLPSPSKWISAADFVLSMGLTILLSCACLRAQDAAKPVIRSPQHLKTFLRNIRAAFCHSKWIPGSALC